MNATGPDFTPRQGGSMNRTAQAVLLMCLLAGTGITHANCPIVAGNPETAPDSRFVDNGDNTVTDSVRELMWSRSPIATLVTYPAATVTADASVLGNHTDWRLPTRVEFAGVMETGCADPAINTTRFNPGSSRTFWTSEPAAGSSVWSFDLTYGSDGLENVGSPKAIFVVRSVALGIFSNGFE